MCLVDRFHRRKSNLYFIFKQKHKENKKNMRNHASQITKRIFFRLYIKYNKIKAISYIYLFMILIAILILLIQ